MGRASFSLKRIAFPSVLAMISSSEPELSLTQFSSSSGFKLMAISPLRRTWL